jgi:enoyl-CoA hydratase
VDAKLLAQIKNFLIDPSHMEMEVGGDWQPLGVVDLDACAATTKLGFLPPFPILGIGDRSHPLAASLDAVLEPPIEIEPIIQQCRRFPHATAIVVQLLRSLEGLSMSQSLTLESLCYGLLQGSDEYQVWLKSRPTAAAAAPSGRVIVERQNDVLHIRLDRPFARNAMDRSLRDELHNAFTLAVLDSDIRSIQLRASGTTFCAGGDLKEFGTIDPATAHLIRSRTLPANAIARCADKLAVHVQGACIGAGLEMSAFAKRFVATDDAWFQLPELNMGLIPGAGGCVSVPRRIGRQRATLMMLSGQRIDATTALEWKLIDAIEALDNE